MSMIVSLIKVSALAAALLCVGAVKPMSGIGPFKYRASQSLPDCSAGFISAAHPSACPATATTHQ